MIRKNDIGKKDRPIFFAIIFLPFLLVWPDITNDIWFLLSSGRYVVQNGIPNIEPLTLHQGLEFVMQQWLSAVIFFSTYSTFGLVGLKVILVVFYALTVYVLFRLCMKLSDNYFFVSAGITFLVSVVLGLWLSCRPIIFSTLIFLLEIYFLESFVLDKNKKHLFFIPILSLVLINMHAALWPMMFIILGPYIIDACRFNIGRISGQGYGVKAILAVTVISFAAGFINPYGWQAMTYLYRSYGHMEIENVVGEMKSPSPNNTMGAITFLAIFLVGFVYILHKTGRTNIRYALLTVGTIYMTLSAQRCIMFFAICASFPLAGYLRNLEVNIVEQERTKREKTLKKILLLGIIMTAAVVIINAPITSGQPNAAIMAMDDVIDEILADANPNELVLYTGYDDGGYAEFRGLKPYLDPRAEVFLIENNKQKDILSEYYNMERGWLNYKDFLSRYQFTHLIVNRSDSLYASLSNDADYKAVYTNDYYTLFVTVD